MFYEIWFSPDNSESSLLPTKVDDEARRLLTYDMNRALRFWAPSFGVALFVLRLYRRWRFSDLRAWWYR